MAHAVAQDMPTKLSASRVECDDTETAHRLALKRRRRLIFEAVDDEGMHQREVARLLGIRQSRVSAILAAPDGDEE